MHNVGVFGVEDVGRGGEVLAAVAGGRVVLGGGLVAGVEPELCSEGLGHLAPLPGIHVPAGKGWEGAFTTATGRRTAASTPAAEFVGTAADMRTTAIAAEASGEP